METQEIITQEPEKAQLTVFGTNDPQGILTRAKTVADALVPIIDQQKLYLEVKGKKHVYVEGWTTMIAMLGVFPHVTSCMRLEREDEIIYEAKVVLRNLAGAQVGAGEAICSNHERNWANRDEYAIKSMAQTRAVGKACRLSFSWLIGMAGFAPLPAEELPNETKPAVTLPQAIKPQGQKIDPSNSQGTGTPAKEADLSGDRISDKQRKLIFARSRSAGIREDEIKAYLKEAFKIEHTADLRWQDLKVVLEWIENYGPKDETPYNVD